MKKKIRAGTVFLIKKSVASWSLSPISTRLSRRPGLYPGSYVIILAAIEHAGERIVMSSSGELRVVASSSLRNYGKEI